jgi:hypothetical protein
MHLVSLEPVQWLFSKIGLGTRPSTPRGFSLPAALVGVIIFTAIHAIRSNYSCTYVDHSNVRTIKSPLRSVCEGDPSADSLMSTSLATGQSSSTVISDKSSMSSSSAVGSNLFNRLTPRSRTFSFDLGACGKRSPQFAFLAS